MAPALKRRLVRLGRRVLFVYLCAILVLSLLQSSLIFPGQATQGRRESQVVPRGSQDLVRLRTRTGETVYALWTPAEGVTAAAPTVLFFYGNAMTVADSEDIIRMFHRLGCNVLVPEYVGFGMSTGKPSEAQCYATADAAYEHLLARPGADPRNIIAAGWSLGAGVATDLASRRPCRALMTFSAFTSMADMAARVMPLFPARLMLHHHFDNLAKFATLQCPVLCGHGRRDSIIPVEMTQRLARAAGVTPVIIDDADHNDFFDVGGMALEDSLRDFLSSLAR